MTIKGRGNRYPCIDQAGPSFLYSFMFQKPLTLYQTQIRAVKFNVLYQRFLYVLHQRTYSFLFVVFLILAQNKNIDRWWLFNGNQAFSCGISVFTRTRVTRVPRRDRPLRHLIPTEAYHLGDMLLIPSDYFFPTWIVTSRGAREPA